MKEKTGWKFSLSFLFMRRNFCGQILLVAATHSSTVCPVEIWDAPCYTDNRSENLLSNKNDERFLKKWCEELRFNCIYKLVSYRHLDNGVGGIMLAVLLVALESDEDRQKFIETFEQYHARMERTAKDSLYYEEAECQQSDN